MARVVMHDDAGAPPPPPADEPPHPRRSGSSSVATCGACRIANVHAQPSRHTRTRCAMCCGYAMPAGMSLTATLLFLGSEVYYLVVLAQEQHTAWRVAVCVVCVVVAAAMYVPFMWSYYMVVFTSPGFVPAHPWRHRPRVCVDGAVPPATTTATVATAAAEAAAATPAVAATVHDDVTAVAVFDDGTPTVTAAPSTAADVSAGSTAVVVVAAAGSSGGDKSNDKHAVQQQQQSLTASSSAAHTQGSNNATAASHAAAAAYANPFVVTQLSSRRQVRYCARCEQYKPDDAHHCSTCGRCVYNFDHHCPWINNCVGRNNYKLFLVFLLYSGVAGLCVGALDVVVLAVVDTTKFEDRAGWLVLPALLLALGAGTLLFHVQHRVMLAQGRSTLDTIIADAHQASRGNDMIASCRGSSNHNNSNNYNNVTRAQRRAARKARIRRHRAVLLGHEQPWWRRYLPLPIRVDDVADPV